MLLSRPAKRSAAWRGRRQAGPLSQAAAHMLLMELGIEGKRREPFSEVLRTRPGSTLLTSVQGRPHVRCDVESNGRARSAAIEAFVQTRLQGVVGGAAHSGHHGDGPSDHLPSAVLRRGHPSDGGVRRAGASRTRGVHAMLRSLQHCWGKVPCSECVGDQGKPSSRLV